MLTGGDGRSSFAWGRWRGAEYAEPVNETMSSSRTWPNRSRAEPQIIEIAPSGKIAAFTISSTIRCVTQAVGEAGFTRIGTPDSTAGAAFSQRPQAAKLNTLINTPSPFPRTQKHAP